MPSPRSNISSHYTGPLGTEAGEEGAEGGRLYLITRNVSIVANRDIGLGSAQLALAKLPASAAAAPKSPPGPAPTRCAHVPSTAGVLKLYGAGDPP